MSALWKLSVLALRGVVFGACQAIGLEAGEKAGEAVSRFLGDRFGRQGERVLRALERANDRAWDTLEFALAGESLWQRCTALYARPDDRAFREQVRGFLDGLPAAVLDLEGPEFRRLALAELRLARKEGALRVSGLDPQQLAASAGQFASFATPQSLWQAETTALADIAGSFPGERYAHLRKLLELAPPDGTPLLTAAARYFFRREIEVDRELFQGLAFVLLEDQSTALEAGLRHLEALLGTHSARLEHLVVDVVQLASLTHDEVRKISAKLDQVLARHHLAGRELRPDDTLLTISEDERRLVRDLVRSYRALPDGQKAARMELAFKVGQAEAITGDLAGAQRDFEAAARLTEEPAAQAEAHASAFQVALGRRDLNGALASLLEAARLDAVRFAPFPLDKYRPERILGAGGFGVAVLCRHAFQRARVVVKSLWAAGLDRSIDDVFNEAQVLAGLSHPAIVPVLDCDYADRKNRFRPYVVMEFFEGVSLLAHVEQRGPFQVAAFLPLARQLAEGLRTAHGRGIYHRDVKPANVLVGGLGEPAGSSRRDKPGGSPSREEGGGGGVARLIDFGLALRPATLAISRTQGEHSRRTALGTSIAGTYKYAAPEQLGELPGVSVGPASDVYSFARTCYFALLGTPDPDDEEKAQLPDGWRRLLSRCTARVPTRRPQSMQEVLDELASLAASPEKPAPVVEPLRPLPPLEPLPPLRPTRPSRSTAQHVEATCLRTLTTVHEATVSSVAFHPQGGLLATGGFDDRVRLWAHPSGAMQLSLDAHGADVNCVAFHPDGHVLATSADDREVRLWRVPDGKLVGVLRHPERVYAVAYSPDGKLIATGCDDHKVRVWQSAFLAAPMLTLSAHTSFVRAVAFSPDGKLLASGSGDRLVHLWSVPDGQRRQTLTGHAHVIWGVAFSPDGRRIATASQDRSARVWDAGTGRPVFVLEGHADHVWSVSFCPHRRLLATASHDRTARIWSADDGRHLATLHGHTGLVRAVAFSPDGRTLATASGDGTVRLWHVHDADERCDWSVATPTLPPRARVRLTRAGNGVVYPGDELWLNVEVENAGRGDLVQLGAHVESSSPLLRGLLALFGRVRAGETVSRCPGIVVPTDAPPGELRGEVVFREANEYHPSTIPIVFHIRALPRDDFHVRWRLADDGTGNSSGDGDGRPQRGECLDVVATVENQTGEELHGLTLTLTAVEVPTGVVVNVPRAELEAVAHGARVEGRVTFSVRPSANTGPARFELRVEAADGRLFARVPVETTIE